MNRKVIASSFDNSAQLREQYRDLTNLQARMDLHERFRTTVLDWHAWLFEHFDLPRDARILEIGCDTGLLWQKNRARLPATWQLTLTDFSRGMLESARQSVSTARFTQCDSQAIPFAANAFDAAIANHMLYHVPDIPRALVEIRRALKPGGKFYAATNGAGHLQEIWDLLASFIGNAQMTDGSRFSLENGGEYLSRCFMRVERFDFDDALVVTEAEPLFDYMMSMRVAKQMLTPEMQAQLRVELATRIARDGAIRIQKSVGLFVAA